MKKLIIAALALTALPLVTACNTVKGVGKDVQATGEAVEDVAQDVENELKD